VGKRPDRTSIHHGESGIGEAKRSQIKKPFALVETRRWIGTVHKKGGRHQGTRHSASLDKNIFVSSISSLTEISPTFVCDRYPKRIVQITPIPEVTPAHSCRHLITASTATACVGNTNSGLISISIIRSA